MNTLQYLIDGMLQQWQKERAETQMTLGKIIKRLKELPQDMKISGLGELASYRGYYIDLAFEPDVKEKTVSELLTECQSAMGKVFVGYGGGEYMMGELTPLWVAPYGRCGKKLMSINDDGTIDTAYDD